MKRNAETITEDEWNIENLPLGAEIQLGTENKEQRIAKARFNEYLFAYFHDLSVGYTGWGIDFHGWLELSKGWKHVKLNSFIRVPAIDEMQ